MVSQQALVDKRMTRWDCMRWLNAHGDAVPFCELHYSVARPVTAMGCLVEQQGRIKQFYILKRPGVGLHYLHVVETVLEAGKT